ncbi:hypothetical protein K461DRAFT_252610 [Myriangium duriaei CBS 260.36]|uniref:FAM192A/Fyv6 N-terminal domain-containing protein n=1 Tax=Myriangium duriaei CBS 260.36 TaxID=1168546 RepID=A0A9P4J6W9_9PEZI|nr:hypothetical protein K461DRAFT_252610 [Myriangium duriaei CBS 260.36]
MSRFVAGGTVDQPTERSDEWLKAQQAIEAKKAAKLPVGQQEGGKSLYETLQANKAAKQDAFEESIRLKNQFRSLDADEVDFLDSLTASSRAAETAVRRDTEEQLAAFRAAREAEERKARTGSDSAPAAEIGEWAASGKKRKREEAGALLGVKARRVSSSEEGKVDGAGGEGPGATKPVVAVGTEKGEDAPKSATIKSPSPAQSTVAKAPSPSTGAASGSLGLAGYSSSEDD